MKEMTRERAINLLRDGPNGIEEWNQWRSDHEIGFTDLDLNDADLSGIGLSNANLSDLNLSGTDFRRVYARHVNFQNANLSGSIIADSSIFESNLIQTNLSKANLSHSVLFRSDFYEATLSFANFTNSRIYKTIFHRCELQGCRFNNSTFFNTTFADCDLSTTVGLDDVTHEAPSTVGINTILQSKGAIPESFLRGIGSAMWMIAAAKLADPNMSASQIANVLSTEVFSARTKGPLYLGGCFISYSHANTSAVDQLNDALRNEGLSTWLDRHDMEAGPIEQQIMDAIRINDIVLLALSEDSLQSDWVWQEIDSARKKEKTQKRHVLCPIALDDSWQKPQVDKERHINYLKERNILDFSKWNGDRSAEPFQKLLRGLKKYYLSP